jgi:hypothetical protein
MHEAASSRDNFYKVKRHQYPIVANSDIIAAEIMEDVQAALAQFAEIAAKPKR